MIEICDSWKNDKLYDGTTPKFGISYNHGDYIVKAEKDNGASVYCEYVASNFIKNVGIPVHEVLLGFYNGDIRGIKYNGVVNVIKDFTSDIYSLHSFKDLGESSVDTSLDSKSYAYKEIEYIISHITKSDKNVRELMLHRFWQMFICDAILGNRDRHFGNWGFLKNTITNKLLPAPLFDNGACLFPDVLRVINQLNNNTYQFLYDRTVVFPASLLKIYSEDEHRYKRTNYKQVFSDLRISPILAEERNNFITKVTQQGVLIAIINATADRDIPVELVNFYRLIVMCRFYCIVMRLDFNTAYKNTISDLKGYLL